MGDITDLFSTKSRTKVTPTKGYNANFTTNSTSFVDVTSVSITVPNNAFYCFRGLINVIADTPVRTISIQILLGASVVFSDSQAGDTASTITKKSDSLILQNTTGSSQTAKLQIKVDGGVTNSGIKTASIIQGSFILPFDANKYALQQISADVSSIDFVSCLGDGVSYVSYDGTQIIDNVTSAVTYNTLEKFVNLIQFITNLSITLQIGTGTSPATVITGAGYVAFDFTGKYLVL